MLGNGGNTFKTGFVPKSSRLSAMVQLVREIATPSISLFRSKALLKRKVQLCTLVTPRDLREKLHALQSKTLNHMQNNIKYLIYFICLALVWMHE